MSDKYQLALLGSGIGVLVYISFTLDKILTALQSIRNKMGWSEGDT